ncbi:MAG: MFS transporter [Haloarculaceae archaeon]
MAGAGTEETGADEGERLVAGYSGRVFLLVAGGTLVVNLGRGAIPPLLPAIIDDLSITPAAAGVALTAIRVAFAACQYPSGRVADGLSRKLAIAVGLAVTVGGFALLSSAANYPGLVAAAVLLGVGSAFFFVAERILLSDLFVARRGRAFGANSAVSRIGSIAAAGLAVAVLSAGGWRLAFPPVALLLIGVVAAFHLLVREPYRIGRLGDAGWIGGIGANARATVARVFGRREIRWLVVAYTLVIFAWEGTLGFLPAFLQASKGASPAIAGGGFASLFAVGIVVQPLAGGLSDRWDRRLVAGVATLASAGGLGTLVLAGSLAGIWAGIVLYAAGVMAFTPAVQAHLMDVFPEASKGGDLGAFKTVYEGLSGLGPAYVGVVAGLSSYEAAFGGFVGCLLVGAGIVLWLSRTAPDGGDAGGTRPSHVPAERE